MIKLSTREAAKKLGISYETLAHYVAQAKVPAPEIVTVGRRVVHMWTESEVEAVRQLLPKIANGRKTRYKKQSAVKKQSTKTKTPPRAAVPHKSRKKK
jgi:predicted DNA-binding transcriptional regulator AlpA